MVRQDQSRLATEVAQSQTRKGNWARLFKARLVLILVSLTPYVLSTQDKY